VPDTGELTSIGDRRLYASVSGNGPVVVLNSGGGQAGIEHWSPILADLRQFATVITYDRAGLGRSEPPPAPPSALDMVADLHALLDALGAERPVVLLGSSISALLVQLYACEYADEVSGLVLLDPTPDRYFRGFMTHAPAVRECIRQTTIENSKKMGGSDALLLEVERMPESSEQVHTAIEEQGRLPDIPLIVLTAGRRAEIKPTSGAAHSLESEHRHIARRTSQGRQILAANSAHRSMTVDEPDLIVGAIRSILDGDIDVHSSG
jgi:pimeloyl-ACP methyl ester carboxylesterase